MNLTVARLRWADLPERVRVAAESALGAPDDRAA